MLAGERGPSYTAVSQVKNWKLLQIRFIEAEANGLTVARAKKIRAGSHRKSEPYGMLEEEQIGNRPCSSFSIVTGRGSKSDVESSIFAESVPLSQLITIGTLIPPRDNIVTVEVESFDVSHRCWQDPFTAQLSVSIDEFASGGTRDAYSAKGIAGLEGKIVVKRYRSNCIEDIERLFNSSEDHTRKTVQMHSLAQHFAVMFSNECPRNFGKTFHHTKLFYARLENEAVTTEKYPEGICTKYINNTGDINHADKSEVAAKAQTFVHYSYVISRKQIMILDLQAV